MFRLLGKDKKLRDAVVLQAVHLLKEDLDCYVLAGTTMLNKESDHQENSYTIGRHLQEIFSVAAYWVWFKPSLACLLMWRVREVRFSSLDYP